jgi:endonuclease-3
MAEAIPWDVIFNELNKWSSGEDDPVVTVIGDEFAKDPWALLASTVLSLRTKDETTGPASRRLLEKAPGPKALLKIPVEEVARLIYPVGFYKTKAENLHRIAALLVEQYGGKVPSNQEALLALPGVGLKTANLVLSEAFGIDAICVDTHVHRICNRAGWVETSEPVKTEAALREILPKKYWQSINIRLVRYGQEMCRPISPWCSRCVIAPYCARCGVERSR